MSSQKVKYQRRFNQEQKPEAVKVLTPDETNIYFNEDYGKIENLEVSKKLITDNLTVHNTIKCKELKCLEMERIKRDFKALSLKFNGDVKPQEVIQPKEVLNQKGAVSLDIGLKFVNELKPVKFTSQGKTHYGLVKAEVEKISKLAGVNAELVDETNQMTDNLTALLIKSVHSLSKRLDVLEKGGASWND